MMGSLQVVTGPLAEPLTLDEVKTYLRVDSSDEDDFVQSLIVAARSYCEAYTNRMFVTQTLRMYLDGWPSGDVIEVPRPFDASTNTLVRYYASGSTSATTLAASSYWLDNQNEPGRIVLRNNQEWPTTELRSANGVEVTLVAGYGGEADVPDAIRGAMRMLVGHWYANREAVVVGTISQSVALTVNAMLAPHIVPAFA